MEEVSFNLIECSGADFLHLGAKLLERATARALEEPLEVDHFVAY